MKKSKDIQDRFAAFKASDFEKAFAGFDFFNEKIIAHYAEEMGDEIADWMECFLEEESSFLFAIDKKNPINPSDELDSKNAKDLFGNPEDYIILFDNIKQEKNYIGAICIFNKESLRKNHDLDSKRLYHEYEEAIEIELPYSKR